MESKNLKLVLVLLFFKKVFYFECGVIHRGRPEIQFQTIARPEQNALDLSKRLAHEIIAKYREADPRSIDPVGSSASFTDPGSFNISASDGDAKIELATSVDWVEQQRSALATILNRFAQSVRGLPSRSPSMKAPCGSAEFYGIPRLQ